MAKKKQDIDQLAEDIEELTPTISKKPVSYGRVISTGSTLLDLSISGEKIRGGGVPSGIIAEFYGPEGSGKTAILSEMVTSCQLKGGFAKFQDPEGRLDEQYAQIYGVSLEGENYDYSRPRMVETIFDEIRVWSPPDSSQINMIVTDSLAALSTELELGEKGDKMGMSRGKRFSEGFRKVAVDIADNEWILACSNQLREGQFGETTPGGRAIRFYSSLRVRVGKSDELVNSIEIERNNEDNSRQKKAKVESIYGIKTHCVVKKSTVGVPFRSCDIYIVFNYGIHDIMGNLQYIKDMTLDTMYQCPDKKRYKGVEQAISHVEQENLENQLREDTIDLWMEIQDKLQIKRKPKVRR